MPTVHERAVKQSLASALCCATLLFASIGDGSAEPTASLYKRITKLYKEQRFYEVEPLMRQYIAQLERSNVPSEMLRQHYASYAALLRKLNRQPEAKIFEAKSYGVAQRSTAGNPAAKAVPEIADHLKGYGVIGIKFVTAPGVRARINTVFPGTPAADAGIQKDDQILAIDGQPVALDESKEDIYDRVIGTPGTKVQLTVLRGAQQLNFDLERISLSKLQEPHVRRDYLNSF